MYFASIDERRWVEQGLQADARRLGVADELRGWSWHQPPLKPMYRSQLDPAIMQEAECPTGRDLYWMNLGLIGAPRSPRADPTMLRGAGAAVIQEAKALIYEHGAGCIDHLERRTEHAYRQLRRFQAGGGAEMEASLWGLRAFELRRVLGRVLDALSRHGGLGAEALATSAVPVSVDVVFDGRPLGIGQPLCIEAISWADMTVIALEFGGDSELHRMRTTAYALALESLYGRPVDVGVVVYVRVTDGRVAVRREYHLIGDEERQIFIEHRDEQMRVADGGLDPGVPAECPLDCRYLATCHPNLTELVLPSERRVFANPRTGAVAVNGHGG